MKNPKPIMTRSASYDIGATKLGEGEPMIDPNSSAEIEYASQFWSLANAITAFAVLQALTYLYAVGRSDSKIVGAVLAWREWIALGIAVVSVFYCGVVLALGWWERTILEGHHLVVLRTTIGWVTYGRLFTVAFVGVATSSLTLWGEDPRKRSGSSGERPER